MERDHAHASPRFFLDASNVCASFQQVCGQGTRNRHLGQPDHVYRDRTKQVKTGRDWTLMALSWSATAISHRALMENVHGFGHASRLSSPSAGRSPGRNRHKGPKEMNGGRISHPSRRTGILRRHPKNRQLIWSILHDMKTKLSADEKRLYRRIAEILWEEWDPIGVNDGENKGDDEYENYVPHIFRLTLEGNHPRRIAGSLSSS